MPFLYNTEGTMPESVDKAVRLSDYLIVLGTAHENLELAQQGLRTIRPPSMYPEYDVLDWNYRIDASINSIFDDHDYGQEEEVRHWSSVLRWATNMVESLGVQL